MKSLITLMTLSSALMLTACGGSSSSPAFTFEKNDKSESGLIGNGNAQITTENGDSTLQLSEAAKRGKQLFADDCSSCHQDNLDGSFTYMDDIYDVKSPAYPSSTSYSGDTLEGYAKYIEEEMYYKILRKKDDRQTSSLEIAEYLWSYKQDHQPTSSGGEQDKSDTTENDREQNQTDTTTKPEPKGPTVVYAINMGSDDNYTSQDNIEFQSEKEFSINIAEGGERYYDQQTAKNTDDPTLYRSNRYGQFSLELDVADGEYTVTIYTIETYFQDTGERVMSVKAEDTPLMQSVDLVSVHGYMVAAAYTETVFVNDRSLSIDFTASTNFATVSAILVTSDSGTSMDTNNSNTNTNSSTNTTMDSTSESTENTQANFGDIDRGKRLFQQGRCATCHIDKEDGTFSEDSDQTKFFDVRTPENAGNSLEAYADYIDTEMVAAEKGCDISCAKDITAYLWNYR